MTIDELLKNLEGKKIKKVEESKSYDCGLEITFTDDTTLSYGYSGCEGLTFFNGENIEELN